MKLNFSLNTGDFDRNWTVNAVVFSNLMIFGNIGLVLWKKETLFLHSLVNILSSCSIDSYYCLYFYLFSYLFLNSDFREGNSSEDAEDLDLNSPERESEYSRRFSLGKWRLFFWLFRKHESQNVTNFFFRKY